MNSFPLVIPWQFRVHSLSVQGWLSQGVMDLFNGASVEGWVPWGTLMLNEQKRFLRALLENLADNPELLGNAGPGSDAVADPDRLTDALLAVASK